MLFSNVFVSAQDIIDLQGIMDEQLAVTNVVVIDPGRYYVEPTSRQHLRLENLNDVTIVAEALSVAEHSNHSVPVK